jgi:hypothetical protein
MKATAITLTARECAILKAPIADPGQLFIIETNKDGHVSRVWIGGRFPTSIQAELQRTGKGEVFAAPFESIALLLSNDSEKFNFPA